MRLRLLDILACPVCGGAPLHFVPLADHQLDAAPDHLAHERPCRNWCAALGVDPNESAAAEPAGADDESDAGLFAPPCEACNRRILDDAILVCPKCARWYAARGGIPDLVRDGLRHVEVEQDWLRRHRDRVPPEILTSGKPFGVDTPPGDMTRSPDEDKLVREGRYWGEFLEVFWKAGDRSIMDVRAVGSHPAFAGQGVWELDERDRWRRLGVWPDHLGRLLHDWMNQHGGDRALDIGCGGGQYGLEAARRGLDVVGIDPSRRSLELGSLHASETGAVIQYVRADPAEPPFRPGAFDVLMAKDSLHHAPDLRAMLDRLDALLRPGGRIAAWEHVAHSPWKGKILRRLQLRLIPRIQRRYGYRPAPDILLHESPSEDAGAELVEPELKRRYRAERIHRELFLYFDAEALFYYASGKRRWAAWAARTAFWWLERLLLALGARTEHLAFIGFKPEAPPETPPPVVESDEGREPPPRGKKRDVPGWPRWKAVADRVLGGVFALSPFRADWTAQEKGRWGEFAAARFLHAKGHRLLAQNVFIGGGELDLVSDDGGTLVFTEVRTRFDAGRHPPMQTLDAKKMRLLRAAATAYLEREAPSPRPPARIDFVSVVPGVQTGLPDVQHRGAIAWLNRRDPAED